MSQIYQPSSLGQEIAFATSKQNPNFQKTSLMELLISPIASPEEQCMVNSEFQEVMNKLGKLSSVFDLIYMQGYSIKETSNAMHISESTCKRRLKLGKEKLLKEVH